MRGLFSNAPAPSAIQLLVGSHLLLLVQAGLVLRSRGPLEPMLSIIVLMLAIIGLTALITAAIGEPHDPSPERRTRARHGR